MDICGLLCSSQFNPGILDTCDYFGLTRADECWCGNAYDGSANDPPYGLYGDGGVIWESNNANHASCPGGECPITDCDANGVITNGVADLCANGDENSCRNRAAVYSLAPPNLVTSECTECPVGAVDSDSDPLTEYEGTPLHSATQPPCSIVSSLLSRQPHRITWFAQASFAQLAGTRTRPVRPVCAQAPAPPVATPRPARRARPTAPPARRESQTMTPTLRPR